MSAQRQRDQARDERLKANEREFRNFNVVLGSAARRVSRRGSDGVIRFVCECSNRRCTEPVYLREDEYLAVRADDRRFVVVCGHEIARIEDVVERHDRYCVVRKH